MAYAGDLKSPDAHASCGFDPHPGHQSNPHGLAYRGDAGLLKVGEPCEMAIPSQAQPETAGKV
jgi:hypothetical protein